MEKLDKGVNVQRAQGKYYDCVWNGDEEELGATFFTGEASPSQQKVIKFPKFVTQQS